MMHWIQSNGGHPLLIRASSDPREDVDAVPQFWHTSERRWIDDEDLASEMLWDPNIRPATDAEVQSMVGPHAADQQGHRGADCKW